MKSKDQRLLEEAYGKVVNSPLDRKEQLIHWIEELRNEAVPELHRLPVEELEQIYKEERMKHKEVEAQREEWDN